MLVNTWCYLVHLRKEISCIYVKAEGDALGTER